MLKARDLIGTFDKPRYITFTEDLCAHSRSKIVGCRRCLDLCPTGAIAPNGDHVAIDPQICAGCGQCAAACPTGAAAYALPPSDALLRRLRTLLGAYREAGGKQAVVMFHDAEHGGELIDALARHGDGLPANVLPVQINEVTQVGLEAIAASFAYGASAVRFLIRAKPRHDIAGLAKTVALAEPILAGLGFSGARVATIETDDPDALGSALRAIAPMDGAAKPATFSAVGHKRDVVRLALRELHAAAPTPVDIVALPQGAPFGTVEVNVEGCTLCLSCVAACPTGALSDDPEKPMLRFAEDACVQCGLCQATCPEKVIRLKPQIDFRAATAPEPHHQAGRAVRLHPLRQAVRRQKLGRAGGRQARRRSIGCSRTQRSGSTSSRCAPTVAWRPWRRRISIRSAAPSARLCAPPTIICASGNWKSSSANTKKSKSPDRMRVRAPYFFVVFAKNSTSAWRSSAEPIFCSGILVPGV